MKNINMENIFNVFSDYLDKPQNIDINYTMNLVMKINDVFSTNLTFQTIYNDNSYSGFQIREVFGLGVNVKFIINSCFIKKAYFNIEIGFFNI